MYTNVTKVGKYIGFRGYDKKGDRVQFKDEFFPQLFISASGKNTKYSDYDGFPLESVRFDSMWEAKQYMEKWKDVTGFRLYGQENWIFQYLSEKFNHLPLEKASVPFQKIRTAFLDIETECEYGFPDASLPREKVNVVTVIAAEVCYVLTSKTIAESAIPRIPGLKYEFYDCGDEYNLLRTFVDLVNEVDPDVFTGWNIETFDIPYLVNRINYVLGDGSANDLSPWKSLYAREVEDDYGNARQSYTIHGIAVLDYLKLYKKYRMIPRESYKLDYIAKVELNRGKLDWTEKYNSMKEFYTKDFQLFTEYNIQDVDIVVALEAKLKLLELHTKIAYTALINFEDVFSPVRTWDAIIHNDLMKRNIVIPINQGHSHKDSQYAGAYVKEPVPGMYDWIASFDVNSLYPMLIAGKNISPEKIIGKSDIVAFRDHIAKRMKKGP